ncbi:hypothetical protein Tco_0511671, partial [Tanacetum coccineum]
ESESEDDGLDEVDDDDEHEHELEVPPEKELAVEKLLKFCLQRTLTGNFP